MKNVKRIAIGLLVLVLLVVSGVVILASTIDINSYKDEIAREIEAATGRKVTIAGKLEKSVLTLTPAIVANDVSLANVGWGTRPEMVKAKKIELAIDLLPLLSGSIRIRRFELVGADILLETDGKGRVNWELSQSGTSPPAGKTPTAAGGGGGGGAGLPRIAEVSIRGTTITFRDGGTKLASVVKLDEVEMRAPGRDRPIELKTKASYQDVPLTTEGTLGSVASLLGGAKAYPVDMKVHFGESDLAVKLTADLSGKVPLVTGTISGKELDIKKVRSTFGGTGGGKAGGGGRIFSPDPLPVGFLHGANGKVTVSIGKLHTAARVIEDLSATLALKDGKLDIDPFSAKTAGGSLKGSLTIDARTDKPALVAKLSGSGLSLSEVSGQSTVASRLNLTVNLSGRGGSMRALAGTARGVIVAVAGSGPINSSTLSFISTGILQAIPVLGKSRRLALNCIVARFDFVNGTGTSRVLVIDTTRMTIAGKGTVSLRNEAVDLILVPSTKDKSLASVAALVPIRVRGPLTGPQASPDPTGVPKEVVGAIFNTLEMPVNIVGSLLGNKKSSRAASPCATARAQAAGTHRPGTGGTNRSRGSKPGVIDRINPFKR